MLAPPRRSMQSQAEAKRIARIRVPRAPERRWSEGVRIEISSRQGRWSMFVCGGEWVRGGGLGGGGGAANLVVPPRAFFPLGDEGRFFSCVLLLDCAFVASTLGAS